MSDTTSKRVEARAAQEPADKVVCFGLSDQHFAIPIQQVKETVAMRHITRVFHMPEFVKGVINLRGEIVAVLDPSLLLRLGPQSVIESSRIVIARAKDKTWGLLTSFMSGVRPYRPETLEDASALLGSHPEWVLGILGESEPPAAVMDMEKLLDAEPLRALASATHPIEKSATEESVENDPGPPRTPDATQTP